MAIRVTVWNEYLHEVQFPEVAEVYPKGRRRLDEEIRLLGQGR